MSRRTFKVDYIALHNTTSRIPAHVTIKLPRWRSVTCMTFVSGTLWSIRAHNMRWALRDSNIYRHGPLNVDKTFNRVAVTFKKTMSKFSTPIHTQYAEHCVVLRATDVLHNGYIFTGNDAEVTFDWARRNKAKITWDLPLIASHKLAVFIVFKKDTR